MAQDFAFARNTVFPSWFANRIQDIISAAQTELTLRLKSDGSETIVEVAPDEPTGLAAICIQGRWRFNSATVERTVPGNGTYIIWAVAYDNVINNTPDPYTDHTDYTWTLRMTTGANPSGTGVEVFEPIGVCVVAGGKVTTLRQTANEVSGAQIADGAITGLNMTITRLATGVQRLALGPDSVGPTEIQTDAVGPNEIQADAVGTPELAPSAVTTYEILDATILGGDIAAEAITNREIADGTIRSQEIGTGEVKRGDTTLDTRQVGYSFLNGGGSSTLINAVYLYPGEYIISVATNGGSVGKGTFSFHTDGAAGTITQSIAVGQPFSCKVVVTSAGTVRLDGTTTASGVSSLTAIGLMA